MLDLLMLHSLPHFKSEREQKLDDMVENLDPAEDGEARKKTHFSTNQ